MYDDYHEFDMHFEEIGEYDTESEGFIPPHQEEIQGVLSYLVGDAYVDRYFGPSDVLAMKVLEAVVRTGHDPILAVELLAEPDCHFQVASRCGVSARMILNGFGSFHDAGRHAVLAMATEHSAKRTP